MKNNGNIRVIDCEKESRMAAERKSAERVCELLEELSESIGDLADKCEYLGDRLSDLEKVALAAFPKQGGRNAATSR